MVVAGTGENSTSHSESDSVIPLQMTKCRLTTLQISCERTSNQLLDASIISDVSVRTNQLLPQRSTASFAC